MKYYLTVYVLLGQKNDYDDEDTLSIKLIDNDRA